MDAMVCKGRKVWLKPLARGGLAPIHKQRHGSQQLAMFCSRQLAF